MCPQSRKRHKSPINCVLGYIVLSICPDGHFTFYDPISLSYVSITFSRFRVLFGQNHLDDMVEKKGTEPPDGASPRS